MAARARCRADLERTVRRRAGGCSLSHGWELWRRQVQRPAVAHDVVDHEYRRYEQRNQPPPSAHERDARIRPEELVDARLAEIAPDRPRLTRDQHTDVLMEHHELGRRFPAAV